MLKASGCKDIRVMVLVAAPEGVAKVEALIRMLPNLYGILIDGLNEQGYIVLAGDAGDKILVVYKKINF